MGTTTTTVSLSNTPQATDNAYTYTEQQLIDSNTYNNTTNVVTLDVMADDLGGKATTMYSVDDGFGALSELLVSNVSTGWEDATVYLADDDPATADQGYTVRIRIDSGKVQLDLTGALNGGAISDLNAGESLSGHFLYAIRLGNGTLSYADINFTVLGEGNVGDVPTIHGSDLSETLTGTAGSEIVDAGAGDDVVTGGGGYDYLYGGAGNDTLTMGADGGVLDGGAGSDNLVGGTGADTFVIDLTPQAAPMMMTMSLRSADLQTMAMTTTVESDLTDSGMDTMMNFDTTTDSMLLMGGSMTMGGWPIVTQPTVPTDPLADPALYLISQPNTTSFLLMMSGGGMDPMQLAMIETTGGTLTDANFEFVTQSFMMTEGDTGTVSKLLLEAPTAGASPFLAVSSGSGTLGLGNFTVQADGQWTFTASSLDHLSPGEYTDVYTAYREDGASMDITVTVLGVDDLPTFGGALTGALSEDAAQVSGAITVVDPDSTHGVLATSALLGAYGSFTLDASGAWTYNPDARAQALGASDTRTESLGVSSLDGLGSATVTVQVAGVNDAAVVTQNFGLSFNESNVAQTVSGLVRATDIDDGHDGNTLFIGQSGLRATVDHTYGAFSIGSGGQWSYKMDTAMNELASGSSITESVVVHTEDGTAVTLTATVRGTNDRATIGGGLHTTVSEDAVSTGSSISVFDLDSPNTLYVNSSLVGTYGTFNIAPGAVGNTYDWTYTLNANAQTLVGGDAREDSVQIVSADGSTVSAIRVTIEGVNDAPTITGNAAGAVAEDGVQTTGGKLDISDVDLGQSSFQVPASLDGAYGSFTFAADGAWAYTLTNDHAQVQALAAGQSLTDSLTVTSADGSAPTTISVVIAGADEPAIPVDETTFAQVQVGWVVPDIGGQLSLDGAALFAVPLNLQGKYGSFEFSQDGAWHYTLDTDSDAVRTISAFPQDPSENQDSLIVTSLDGSVVEKIVVDVVPRFGISLQPPLYGTDDADDFTVQGQFSGQVGTSDFDDLVFALDGDDIVRVGTGDDVVFGGDGNDQLYAGGGIDRLLGGDGNDALISDANLGGYVLMNGGTGNDFLYGAGNAQDVFFFDNPAGAGPNDAGVDVISQFGPRDSMFYSSDLHDYFLLDASVFTDLDLQSDGSLSLDSFAAFGLGETPTDAGNNHARIIVVAHNDEFIMNDPFGEPWMLTNRVDVYYDANGGSFDDAVQFASVMPSGSTIPSLNSSDFRLTGIIGTAGDDMMVGTNNGDVMAGLAGNDHLLGDGGNDAMSGGAGNDILDGGDGNDILRGGNDDDILTGNAGDDQLIGGTGANTLTGDEGNDHFVFNTQPSTGQGDVSAIEDFTHTIEEADLIVLSASVFTGVAADANGALADGQLYTLTNFNTGTTVDDTTRLVYAAATGALYYDADGGSLDNAMQIALLLSKPEALGTESFLLA